MSLADSLFSTFGLPPLMDIAGDADLAYLTPRGGEAAGPFDVILENETTQRIDDDSGRKYEHQRIVKFPLQDGLPFWTGQSLVGLVVAIGGVDWNFDLVEALSESLATVRLVRRATSEMSRPGFRRK